MTDPARFWNAIAAKYARTPVADPAAFERKIEATLARMRPDHTILDVGCGTGSFALRLAPHAAHVHGLDIASEMVRIAREKAVNAGVPNVTFHVGAFDDTLRAFAPESLDGVCAYNILHLVDDRAAALARIYGLPTPARRRTRVLALVTFGVAQSLAEAVFETVGRLDGAQRAKIAPELEGCGGLSFTGGHQVLSCVNARDVRRAS